MIEGHSCIDIGFKEHIIKDIQEQMDTIQRISPHAKTEEDHKILDAEWQTLSLIKDIIQNTPSCDDIRQKQSSTTYDNSVARDNRRKQIEQAVKNYGEEYWGPRE